jgi:hypothetical protein
VVSPELGTVILYTAGSNDEVQQRGRPAGAACKDVEARKTRMAAPDSAAVRCNALILFMAPLGRAACLSQ